MNLSFDYLRLYSDENEYLEFIYKLESMFTICILSNIEYKIYSTKKADNYHYVYPNKIDSINDNYGWMITINNFYIQYFKNTIKITNPEKINEGFSYDSNYDYDSCLKILKEILYN